MKTVCALISLFIISIGLVSCKKTNSSPATVVHQWSIVKDSLFFDANSPDFVTYVYPGKSGEYFNFSSTGLMYFSDRNSKGVDSIKYQVTSDTTMLIGEYIDGQLATFSYGNANGIWRIDKLTDHTLIFETKGNGPEVGLFGEVFTLSR